MYTVTIEEVDGSKKVKRRKTEMVSSFTVPKG